MLQPMHSTGCLILVLRGMLTNSHFHDVFTWDLARVPLILHTLQTSLLQYSDACASLSSSERAHPSTHHGA